MTRKEENQESSRNEIGEDHLNKAKQILEMTQTSIYIYDFISYVEIKREQLGNLLIKLKLDFDIKIDGDFILVMRENDENLHDEIFT